jgi:tyrosinase
MQVRVEVRAMTSGQLASFRQAVTASMGISDDRGYSAQAGIHGLPGPMWCQHGTPLFLPWHRAYLYLFEKSLQDQVAGVTLPWWDWTSAASHSQGIPDSYTDTSANNPLQSATVAISASDIEQLRTSSPGVMSDGDNPVTVRDPDVPDALPRAATIDSILDASTFEDFYTRLENVHNDVHGWVGGSMSIIPIAAYDPVFWAHHAMIDRLWYVWQMRQPNVSVPAPLLNSALAPFPLTVSQVLDIGQLGYEYSVAAIT